MGNGIRISFVISMARTHHTRQRLKSSLSRSRQLQRRKDQTHNFIQKRHQMELQKVIGELEKKFPLRLAEKWDNVGLLVEPTAFGRGEKKVKTVTMTIDLTEKVLDEAIANKSDLIFSYHPPIFVALKRLTTREVKERIVIRAIENGIAIFSPHTSVDSSAGGVNDWLAAGLGESTEVKVVQPYSYQDPNQALKVHVFVPEDAADRVREGLTSITGVASIGSYKQCTFSTKGSGTFFGGEGTNPAVGKKGQLERVEELRLEMVCSQSALPQLREKLYQVHPYETPAWEVVSLQPLPVPATGQGRLVTLKEPATLKEMIDRIKRHLGIPHLRLALSETNSESDRVIQPKIKTVALCAGSGVSVIGKSKADLLLTGEMGHHDVLAATARGSSVILCEHTNTERGYLAHLQKELDQLFEGKVNLLLSKVDADPLVVF
ncbi:NIF3-like protein 1-like [Planoprotostelium fungivorum]|uniref:NIF3-like protein 1 n=1 Tax=Planoprotostelium fungivorum TaxID=1890364 RepID=A0A2P6MRS5_9EUKA|nr:NIF3-like protein 1-like [Planoprotostelium fungivorum]